MAGWAHRCFRSLIILIETFGWCARHIAGVAILRRDNRGDWGWKPRGHSHVWTYANVLGRRGQLTGISRGRAWAWTRGRGWLPRTLHQAGTPHFYRAVMARAWQRRKR